MRSDMNMFRYFGFECVGGEMAYGIWNDDIENDPDPNMLIFVDFKRKRVFLYAGDGSEPFFLKGEFTKKEAKMFNEFAFAQDKEISDVHTRSKDD